MPRKPWTLYGPVVVKQVLVDSSSSSPNKEQGFWVWSTSHKQLWQVLPVADPPITTSQLDVWFSKPENAKLLPGLQEMSTKNLVVLYDTAKVCFQPQLANN